jgi:hypothetical protein
MTTEEMLRVVAVDATRLQQIERLESQVATLQRRLGECQQIVRDWQQLRSEALTERDNARALVAELERDLIDAVMALNDGRQGRLVAELAAALQQLLKKFEICAAAHGNDEDVISTATEFVRAALARAQL